MRGQQQITFKPKRFEHFWKYKDKVGFERAAEANYQHSQC